MLHRQPDPPSTATIEVSGLLVDLENGMVEQGGEKVRLSPKEAALLGHFLNNPNRQIKRSELLSEVWGYRAGVTTRTVDTTVKTLRRKLTKDGQQDLIRTVRGVGYCFVPQSNTQKRVIPQGLPFPAQSFIGRVDEVETVNAALKSHRIVTVLGPGGVGKTRLTVEIGHHLARSQGVVFCPLRECKNKDDLQSAIASALEVAPAELEDALTSSPPLLIVLDNCEQIAPIVASAITKWTQTSPRVAWLASSRVRLGIAGEFVLQLQGLPLRDARALIEARSGQVLDEEAIGELSERYGGLPLALELAASHLHTLSIGELLAHLAEHELEDPKQIGDHGSFEAIIDSMMGLLSEEQSGVLHQLVTFTSPFDVEAAKAVVDHPSVVQVLRALVDCSVLQRDSARNQFSMVEALRQRVVATRGMNEAAQSRHYRYYAEGCGHWGPAALQARHDELLAAFRFALTHDGTSASRILLQGLEHAHRYRPWGRLELLYQEALEVLTDVAPEVRIDLYMSHGYLVSRRGNKQEAFEDCKRALRLAQQHNLHKRQARLYNHMGVYSTWRDGEKCFRSSVAAYRKLDDRGADYAQSLANLGAWCTDAGRLGDARRMFDDASRILERHGVEGRLAFVQLQLGLVHFLQSDIRDAIKTVTTSLLWMRRLGQRHHEANVLVVRAKMRVFDGRLERAERDLDEAALIAEELGLLYMKPEIDIQRALLCALRGDSPEPSLTDGLRGLDVALHSGQSFEIVTLAALCLASEERWDEAEVVLEEVDYLPHDGGPISLDQHIAEVVQIVVGARLAPGEQDLKQLSVHARALDGTPWGSLVEVARTLVGGGEPSASGVAGLLCTRRA